MRLFAAIDVGPDVRDAALRARREIDMALSTIHVNAPRVLWVVQEGLHVTLRFLGEQPDDRVPAIVEQIEQPFRQRPFSVDWRGVGPFPSPRSPRVFWLGPMSGGQELAALERELARRFGGLDLDREEARPFHPHVTLGRVKVPGAPLDWPAVLERASIGPVRSLVDRVTLYRSRSRPGGAGYEALAVGRLEG